LPYGVRGIPKAPVNNKHRL